jgi:hypothetical protein
MAKESFDQIYVFAKVKPTNQSKEPLFLHSIMTNTKIGDDIHTAYDATATDYDRVFLAYPNLTVPHGKGLSQETTIPPGETVEGTIVSAFRLTKEQWDARKDLTFTFAIQYQPNLVLAPQVPVIVQ